ncbi:hypothetical protein H310_09052 [Aphanomyces invadans]|uniref:Uncharacterized protein n=2 Tax=Aphanomyces invadans TaxID=157072 RepID=A0A024TWH0_9STRA|nr:hypothetical protein H310_09052 [Aphanomyces invadans]ETV98363.1 hypothetical protein H310_09052 [Aphanomyces invadans]|eukprot:XP_008873238.1 hypothetical protein H310_09052 [Aphanomyces invadans]
MDSSDGDAEPLVASGLPNLSNSEKQMKYGPLLILTVAPLVAGMIAAYAVYTYGNKPEYDHRIRSAQRNAEFGWTCLAVVMIGRLIAFANCYPLALESCFLTKDDRQLWTNPFMLVEIGSNATKNVIVMDLDGPVGMYNRANRAIQDMVETCGVVLAALYLASTVFALPAAVVALAFCVGWFLHVVLYATNHDSHGVGYVLATFAAAMLEGMVALMALMALIAQTEM